MIVLFSVLIPVASAIFVCILSSFIEFTKDLPSFFATKIDKLKKSQIDKNLTEIYNDLQMDNNSILIPFSAEKRTGRNDLIALFDEILSNYSISEK